MTPPTQLVPVRSPLERTPSPGSRTEGEAAWAAPFISIATAAPVAAATSSVAGGALRSSLQASPAGYHFRYSGLWSGLVPVIGVTNPTSAVVRNIWLTLSFASSVFPGIYRDAVNGGPPQPVVADVGTGLVDGWSDPQLGSNGDQVTVTLAKSGLGAGDTSFVGDPGSLTGVMLTWASYVSTDAVPFHLGGEGIRTVAGTLTYLDSL